MCERHGRKVRVVFLLGKGATEPVGVCGLTWEGKYAAMVGLGAAARNRSGILTPQAVYRALRTDLLSGTSV